MENNREVLQLDCVYTHLIALPMAVKGVTIPDNEGDYTIIINENLSYECREQVLHHELRHIKMNHFSDTLTVVDAEYDAG